MALSPDHCRELASPNKWNFGLSLFILVGILVSYLPQHHRIITRRSSEGISPYFVLLGTTSATCGLANILALPASRADLACCRVNDGFACFAGALGILQVATQWVCFSIIMLLFLLYFPRASALAPPHAPTDVPSYRTALAIVTVCIVHALLTAVLNLLIALRAPAALQTYASVLGVLAAVLASIQYLPQIYTTARLRAAASLSIPMMCVQTPGAFVWAASLASRVGWEGWSTWGVYVVSGSMQGWLLVMAVVFEVQRRGKGKMVAVGEGGARGNGDASESRGRGDAGERNEGEGRGGESDERTPLIRVEQ